MKNKVMLLLALASAMGSGLVAMDDNVGSGSGVVSNSDSDSAPVLAASAQASADAPQDLANASPAAQTSRWSNLFSFSRQSSQARSDSPNLVSAPNASLAASANSLRRTASLPQLGDTGNQRNDFEPGSLNARVEALLSGQRVAPLLSEQEDDAHQDDAQANPVSNGKVKVGKGLMWVGGGTAAAGVAGILISTLSTKQRISLLKELFTRDLSNLRKDEANLVKQIRRELLISVGATILGAIGLGAGYSMKSKASQQMRSRADSSIADNDIHSGRSSRSDSNASFHDGSSLADVVGGASSAANLKV